jgi:hypothetical protein
MEPTRKCSIRGVEFDLYILHSDLGIPELNMSAIIFLFDDGKSICFRVVGERVNFSWKSYDDLEPQLRGFIAAEWERVDSLGLIQVGILRGIFEDLGIDLRSVDFFRGTDLRIKTEDPIPEVKSVGIIDLAKLKE